MTIEEYKDSMNGVIYLCKSELKGVLPNAEKVRKYNLSDLYDASKRHMLASMVGIALHDCGIIDQRFEKAVVSAKRKIVILETEKKRIFNTLSQVGIWHMALKGTIIRDWYPKFGMRESTDCDILFDKSFEEKVRDIMTESGYTVESYGKGHHDVYYKKPITNMQMHVELFGAGFDDRLNKYYSDIEKRLIQSCRMERAFTPEDFYIYLLAHNHNDYVRRGTGLRSLIDTYIVLKRYDYDWEYIETETNKLGINEFEKKNRELAIHLFDDVELSEEEQSRLEFMLSSGVHGTVDNEVKHFVKKYGGGVKGKNKYIKKRLFIPMSSVKSSFPLFYKYKVLLPFLPIYRLIMGIRRDSKRLKAEIKALK